MILQKKNTHDIADIYLVLWCYSRFIVILPNPSKLFVLLVCVLENIY